MKKIIIRNNVFLFISALILFFIVVFLAIYNYEKQNQTRFMEYIVGEVAGAYNNFDRDPQSFIDENLSDNNRRITILDRNGLVLADTHNYEIGTDLSQTLEIQNIGVVYTTKSSAQDSNLIIIAKQLNDGNYLIVAVEGNAQFLAYYWAISVLIVGGLLAFYYAKSFQLKKTFHASWKQIKSNIELLNKGEYQELSLNSSSNEINEIISEMNEINYNKLECIGAQKSYQVQLNEILDQIKQGVMVYDCNEKLIYYNSDSKALFSIDDKALNQPSNYLIRDHRVKTAIQKAVAKHKLSTFDFELGNKIIEANIFPVLSAEEDQSQITVLSLFKEVSQQRAMEQMKRDFFAHASHELKSPLTAIKGYGELIALGVVKDQEVKKTAEQIVKQSDTMSALVENMLTLSRIENLKEKTYMGNDLNAILRTVVDQLTPSADKKALKLSVESTSIKMLCDEFDFQKLFKNIIENAINYSNENKEVFIILTKEINEIVFRVKDQGIGISKEHQQRVFERFYRVDKGRLDGGTGLGLAIVKHIVLNYNGTIDLGSSLVKGTEVIVRMPIDINSQ